MTMVQFTVPGKPQAKQRPRVTRTGITYTPKQTIAYEALIKESAPVNQVFADSEALDVEIIFYMPIPTSWGKKKHDAALAGEIAHTSRPDVDNLSKTILDGLNKTLYKDDSQVVAIYAEKRYSDDPRVEVMIRTMAGRRAEQRLMQRLP